MAKILSHKRADTRAGVEGQIRHIMDRLEKSVQSRDIEGILAMYAEKSCFSMFVTARAPQGRPSAVLGRVLQVFQRIQNRDRRTHDSCGWRSRLQSLSQPRYG